MTIELQTLAIGVFANVLGDHILIMLLTGAVHLCRRRFGTSGAPSPSGERGMTALDEAMPAPGGDALRPSG